MTTRRAFLRSSLGVTGSLLFGCAMDDAVQPPRCAEMADLIARGTFVRTVRVEKWLLDGEPVHRVVGIAWGGTTTDTPLSVALGDAPFEPIACLPQREASTWGLWEHSFRASSSGVFAIRCRSDDRRVRARRLNSGYYTREIEIT